MDETPHYAIQRRKTIYRFQYGQSAKAVYNLWWIYDKIMHFAGVKPMLSHFKIKNLHKFNNAIQTMSSKNIHFIPRFKKEFSDDGND